MYKFAGCLQDAKEGLRGPPVERRPLAGEDYLPPVAHFPQDKKRPPHHNGRLRRERPQVRQEKVSER